MPQTGTDTGATMACYTMNAFPNVKFGAKNWGESTCLFKKSYLYKIFLRILFTYAIDMARNPGFLSVPSWNDM